MRNWKLSVVFFVLVGALIPVFGWVAGDRVLGRWGDGFWYPASVVSVTGNKIEVDYDDGDNAIVTPSQIKAISWNSGTKLQCNYQNAGKYYPGAISTKTGDDVHIKYDDGDEEDTTIGHCRSK